MMDQAMVGLMVEEMEKMTDQVMDCGTAAMTVSDIDDWYCDSRNINS
jgi:hypothetical protein